MSPPVLYLMWVLLRARLCDAARRRAARRIPELVTALWIASLWPTRCSRG